MKTWCLQGMQGWSESEGISYTNEHHQIAFKIEIWKSKMFRWKTIYVKAQSQKLARNARTK